MPLDGFVPDEIADRAVQLQASIEACVCTMWRRRRCAACVTEARVVAALVAAYPGLQRQLLFPAFVSVCSSAVAA
jgi:hypothetical protein